MVIVECCGISQDPDTGNYVIVMEYMEGGNLRQYLQNKSNKLSFESKFEKLSNIVASLHDIHEQNLVHQDLIVETYWLLLLAKVFLVLSPTLV